MQTKAYLGIDVSKGYSDFVLVDERSQVLEPYFQLTDTPAGRQVLGSLIDKWKQQGLQELYCGVESTGGYENNWHCFLKGLQAAGGVFVARLNPKAVKSTGEALLGRTITDRVSALHIATYVAKFSERVDYGTRHRPTEQACKEGRQILTSIRMWVKQKVQLCNQLEKLLYQHLPELLVYCRHGLPVWMLEMLVKYPSTEQIKKAGVSKLSKLKGISRQKAEAILKKLIPGSHPTPAAMAHLMGITAREVLHQQSLVSSGKAYLNELYKDHPYVALLCDIKGIGLDSAVSLVVEIEEINRFATAKKMASYFGLHPCFKQSGDGLWGNHLSKKGRGEIRAVLYMVALSAVRYNPLFKAVYARFRAKGMSHYEAAGVVMHKLLRVIYGVLKSATPFDPCIEEKHRQQATERQTEKTAKAEEQKRKEDLQKERFIEVQQTAPVSARNLKQRKRRLLSQASNEADTGSTTANANI